MKFLRRSSCICRAMLLSLSLPMVLMFVENVLTFIWCSRVYSGDRLKDYCHQLDIVCLKMVLVLPPGMHAKEAQAAARSNVDVYILGNHFSHDKVSFVLDLNIRVRILLGFMCGHLSARVDLPLEHCKM